MSRLPIISVQLQIVKCERRHTHTHTVYEGVLFHINGPTSLKFTDETHSSCATFRKWSSNETAYTIGEWKTFPINFGALVVLTFVSVSFFSLFFPSFCAFYFHLTLLLLLLLALESRIHSLHRNTVGLLVERRADGTKKEELVFVKSCSCTSSKEK